MADLEKVFIELCEREQERINTEPTVVLVNPAAWERELRAVRAVRAAKARRVNDGLQAAVAFIMDDDFGGP